jgi:hypothetical protein
MPRLRQYPHNSTDRVPLVAGTSPERIPDGLISRSRGTAGSRSVKTTAALLTSYWLHTRQAPTA